MPLAPRVLVVGFDAAERTLVDELTQRGRMPTTARLMAEGLVVDLENPPCMISTPVWPTLATGVRPDRHGAWSCRPLRAGTYRMEWRRPNGPVAHPPIWSTMRHHGMRTATIDVPNLAVRDDVDGVQVVAWGQHDRLRDFAASPARVGREIRRRFPHDRNDWCDERSEAGELDRLRTQCVEDVEQKVALTEWILDQERFDLVWVVFGETHCAGHVFLHLHDEASPRHSAADAARFGDPVVDVFAAADNALGQLLADLDGTPVVALVLSHGMGSTNGAGGLLPPVLRAIDAQLGKPGPWVASREFLRRAPNRAARLARRIARLEVEPLAHYALSSLRFFPVPNFPSHGAIRFNVLGREPAGRVTREELPAVSERLERELLALRDVDTRQPAVVGITHAQAYYDYAEEAGMPDLFVEWDASLPLRGVVSPSIGSIVVNTVEPRPSGHRRDGRVVFWGPGIQPGRRPAMRAEDFAPTLARLLGFELDDVDGVPVPAAIGSARR